MKTTPAPIRRILLCASIILVQHTCFSQGKVVINEYLPWPSNGCGATAEFVELMNFGPGPMDIGCYTLTDGDFSVTIPPNTILQPGQFFVLAGQDIIPAPCANIDSTIHASLNWNTCGCTSGPIPTTGDGFFTDGGSGNEQIVLLDANHQVIDAVVRDLPTEPNSSITTAAMAGCGPYSFNLDTMNVKYEVLGMSTGRGNSFARKLDGDCGWVKDPQQSANATNNTPGVTSDVTYDFFYVQAQDCGANHGTVSVHVRKSDYMNFFPMHYTIAMDIDHNNIFDFADQYNNYIDSTPPDITIGGLPVGHYRLTVESAMGCDLATFEFNILPCVGVLPVTLNYFRSFYSANGTATLQWQINHAEYVRSVLLEKSSDGVHFITVKKDSVFLAGGTQTYNHTVSGNDGYAFYRLKISDVGERILYSPVINLRNAPSMSLVKTGPNPVRNELKIELTVLESGSIPYSIFDQMGRKAAIGQLATRSGNNPLSIPLTGLPAGTYYLQLPGQQQNSLRFVKQ